MMDQAAAGLIRSSGFELRWIHTLWTSPSSNMQITTNVPE
jgi:hypothetical protein